MPRKPHDGVDRDFEMAMTMTVSVRSRHSSGATLLEAYRPGSSFFFASRQGTMLAIGEQCRISARDSMPADLAVRVRQALAAAVRRGNPSPVVVGAIPFRAELAPSLFVPLVVRWAGRLTTPLESPTPMDPPSSIDAQPDEAAYLGAVESALKLIETGQLSKVVLARALRVRFPTVVKPTRLLAALACQEPEAHLFGVDLPGGETLIGASPELLLRRRGGEVTTNPLAGSLPRSADPVVDRRRAHKLLRSKKDLREHAAVVDAVRNALAPYCRTLLVPVRPSVIGTSRLWHLSSRLEGRLADPAIDAMTLTAALHPTPAVCGTPTMAASAALNSLELVERGFYAGMTGWCDASGDGEWALTLRCATVRAGTVTVHAGAGIVSGSSPEAELAETQAKLGTILDALAIDGRGHSERRT
jgi:isochorismate synthase